MEEQLQDGARSHSRTYEVVPSSANAKVCNRPEREYTQLNGGFLEPEIREEKLLLSDEREESVHKPHGREPSHDQLLHTARSIVFHT